MKTMPSLTLDDARRVAAAAEAEALRNGWTVVIAIVDEGGHLLYLQRGDGTQRGSIEVAIAKARNASLFRRATKTWEERLADGRQGYLSLPGMCAIEGGLPLVYRKQCVGAIGVSGVRSDQDGQIAAAGVQAL